MHVSRGTFYQHFDNMASILDAVLDDAFARTEGILEQVQLIADGKSCSKYPLCQFIRENRHLHCIFSDEELTSRIVQKLIHVSEETFVRQMQQNSALDARQIRALLSFQLHGCLAVGRMNLRESDERWRCTQQAVDKFLRAGYGSFWERGAETPIAP